jgi:hypothetical protein
MSTVEEIETAVRRLPRSEALRFEHWFLEYMQAEWDAQLDTAAASGRLDFLAEEGRREKQAGTLKNWPPAHP